MDLNELLKKWRRDFHQYPETGFLEMRTASIVAFELSEMGFNLKVGKEVMDETKMMGKPSLSSIEEHIKWAQKNGAKHKFLDYFKEGYTGVVATLDTKRKGPTIAFRFDMDALPILESDDESHFPAKSGFRSVVSGAMHACGHDSHTAIGLGLAKLLKENEEKLNGSIKIIFQPAEEGTRGAKSMQQAGVVDDVDYFIASHIGVGVPHQHFVAANNGFMATTKMDITFKGNSSHAGSEPEEGKNALLAAASAVLNAHAIPRHSSGYSRVNIGEVHAGSGRNIVPDKATLKAETRGETIEINQYMKEKLMKIIEGSALMQEAEFNLEVVGEAVNITCSRHLASTIAKVAENHSFMKNVSLESNQSAGSEDATYFVNAVQNNGGQATYCVFGTDLAAGHHNERFDINENTMLPAVEILYSTALELSHTNS